MVQEHGADASIPGSLIKILLGRDEQTGYIFRVLPAYCMVLRLLACSEPCGCCVPLHFLQKMLCVMLTRASLIGREYLLTESRRHYELMTFQFAG